MSDGKLLYCDFCGKENAEVRKLIAGPRAHICNGCISLAADILVYELGGPVLIGYRPGDMALPALSRRRKERIHR